ncbi:MAG: hypothetical protein HS126_17645 [Anaerolineales bacterium]|nr:hypothetical protein [Anaerolineales bacterium]
MNQSLAALGELPARQMDEVVFDETQAALYFHDGTGDLFNVLVILTNNSFITVVKQHTVKIIS